MLATKRAAAYGIRFVVALLVAGTEGQTIDKIHRSRALTVRHDLVLEVSVVVLTDLINVTLRNEVFSRALRTKPNDIPSGREPSETLPYRSDP